MKIVQVSDIHVGSGLFRPELLEATIAETNELEPDLVAIAGDLTMEGYRWEFEEAKGYLDRLECPNVVVIPGNHDAKNVGYRHFEEFFGLREGSVTVRLRDGEAKVVALDSTKPDLDEGEVGREHYAWIDSEFRGCSTIGRTHTLASSSARSPSTGRGSRTSPGCLRSCDAGCDRGHGKWRVADRRLRRDERRRDLREARQPLRRGAQVGQGLREAQQGP